MHVLQLTLGAYQTNCYLVWGENSQTCVVIDPGYEPETILAKIVELGLKLETIFLTHGHFDHVGAVEALVKATGCALWMSEADCLPPSTPILNHYFPLAKGKLPDVRFWKHKETVEAGGLTFTVYETPGHTPGSVCIACGDVLFTGDTLFAGSCGRMDLPRGSSMETSLIFLRELNFDGTVLPGHGPGSTMARERAENPYLREAGR